MASQIRPTELEALTRQIGRQMFELMRAHGPRWTQAAWWQERLLREFMRDEALKRQAFRFMDALPALESLSAVARHLREYFAFDASHNGAGHAAPAAQRSAALAELGDAGGRLSDLARRFTRFESCESSWAHVVAWAARRGALTMAQQFIAGANMHEAERAILALRAQRMAFTIDVLGEAALTASEAAEYQRLYLELLTQLPRRAAAWESVPLIDQADGQPLPRVNVSVKLTALYPGIDPAAPEHARAALQERLRPLLRMAMQAGAHLQVDMEHYAIKDLTLATYRELLLDPEFRDYPHFGIVLQAYLNCADRDVAQHVDWARRRGAPSWVRLVKGAYWDSETLLAQREGWPVPVWQQKWQSDACFERCTRALLEHHRFVRVALASHNIRSLSHGLALKRLLEVPDQAFEWQMLFGMGDPIKLAGVALGQRCRIYTPYGELLPGMAYLTRRLLENTANESFLRHSSDENADEDALLANPDRAADGAAPTAVPESISLGAEALSRPFAAVARLDFAEAQSRAQADAALHALSVSPRVVGALIDGQRKHPRCSHDHVNPAQPTQVLARVALAENAEIEAALSSARAATDEWSARDGADRADALLRVADQLEDRRFELLALTIRHASLPRRAADEEVCLAIDLCRYHANQIIRLGLADEPEGAAADRPRGVTAVFADATSPLASAAGSCSAALLTGNPVVLVPALAGAALAERFVELCHDAGVPVGALSLLPLSGAGAVALAQQAGVAQLAIGDAYKGGVLARGPVGSGKPVIHATRAPNVIIVDNDAALGAAVRAVHSAAFGSAGQSALAVPRLILHGAIHDRLLARLVEIARGLRAGPAEDPTVALPPLVEATARDAAIATIHTFERMGRNLLRGEGPPAVPAPGYYVRPAVFVDLPRDLPLADLPRAPLLLVQRAASFPDALKLAGSAGPPRAIGVFSRSPAHHRAAQEICSCDHLFINRYEMRVRVGDGSAEPAAHHPPLPGTEYFLAAFCATQRRLPGELHHRAAAGSPA